MWPNKKIARPNEFCVILDKDGDCTDVCPINDDIIWSVVRAWNIRESEDSPHSPWVWNGEKWYEYS